VIHSAVTRNAEHLKDCHTVTLKRQPVRLVTAEAVSDQVYFAD
jgi:hypothetical protein